MRLLRRPHDSHLLALDATAALLIAVTYAGFARMPGNAAQPAYTGPVWAGLLVATAVGLPVAGRRRWPVPAALTAVAGAVAATLLDITREPYLAVGLTLYAVALTRAPRHSVPVLAAALAASAAAVITGEAVVTPAESWSGATGVAAIVWLVLGGGWAAGFAVRARRAQEADHAARHTEVAIVEERLRIARELHDIVSHSLSLIAVKAGVAGHVAQRRPEEAVDALRVIEQTSRAAMTDMRRALGVLRADTADVPLGPAPGIDDLPLLADQARRAGVAVELTVRVPDEGVSAGISLAVHRIVQESLTNTVKHAAPARCRVTVEADSREVRIDVTDDGVRGPDRAPPGGHGLVGMRERVMTYGGTFSAGPRTEGGFMVSASLPRDGARRTE
ncbi:sensor histidine kinase [Streptomyces sp. NBC_00193]|uniref:sensor histidine kinase n=1 Tax=unclassified Streptomyces TaxID=2593676 RepID=UPI0022565FCC|nr:MULTISPECIES: sensor histidine kinase [unclassified Streptomyces]MCX5123738.1 sensor histidine kinase [Streptomyces sp. NBC_00347]MCX5296986.1 sensor histidine kinase [Streptomyces sp. NBC_00193]